jgi:hypothetical protein
MPQHQKAVISPGEEKESDVHTSYMIFFNMSSFQHEQQQ